MSDVTKECKGTHNYVIIKKFDEFENKIWYYLFCNRCGRVKRITIKKPGMLFGK